MFNSYTFAQQVRAHRAARRMSQIQLATAANTSANIISLAESDEPRDFGPSLVTMQAIADALGCELVIQLLPKKQE